uniref:Uncharacterized protein DDB_G0286175-like n=1 Tax=Dermatophagoides pteronyssinus TaxID=6956 RepID=A0A6P6XKZ6_DERPT|nr:uncharacterized protein DDB_G0286175-like [Dermatophagoides pteronyssinus]
MFGDSHQNHHNHNHHNDHDHHEDVCRQMASTLVDTLMAKAINKCSDFVQFDDKKTITSNTNANAINDNNEITPEIQIDLAGTRTPSPVEESSFELPTPQKRKFKFKVKAIDSQDEQQQQRQQVMTSSSSGGTEDDNIDPLLNNDNDDKHNKHQRSMVQNNCSWLTRTRNAIRRIADDLKESLFFSTKFNDKFSKY